MKKRIIKVISAVAILVTAGFAYMIINKYTGFYIPCVFHLVTGLYCPGCGVSGMCISIAQLDFVSAFKHNSALLVMSPLFVLLFVSIIYRYIKKGSLMTSKWQNVLIFIMIAVLLVFGVLRNIPYFSFLAPY